MDRIPDDLLKAPPHTPAHLFRAGAIYMITASIYQGHHLMDSDSRKAEWRSAFFRASEVYHWHALAWAVMSNHYHVLVQAPGKDASSMPQYVGSFHKFTARRWNHADEEPGRRVWWNYWDTCVRSEKEFISRLQYTLWNPVKHGLVVSPADYAFSNYEECLLKWEKGWDALSGSEVDDVPEF